MKCIVQKYGGSSVADIDKIKMIAAKIAEVRNSGYDIVVVVSAMSKATNQLIEMAKNISKDPPKRELDMLLSTGERTTMALLCIALNELKIDAVSLTGSQAGIITNDRHNDAKVIEVRPFRIQDEIARGKVVVVGGFQGVSYKRDITTLGRGGSDTTAVALAAALNAERCEIYSDVPGVFSADPSEISEAVHLPEISYQQMQEMSLAGAKVMNASAVQFAKESGIAIYARSTFEPGKETLIRKMSPGLSRGVKAVVTESEIARIRILGKKSKQIFTEIISMFNSKNIYLKELSYVIGSDKDHISFVLSLSNIHNWDNIKKEIKSFYKEIIIEETIGAISLIGEGLNNEPEVLKETLELLKSNKSEPSGIHTTAFRISFLIPREKLKECVTLCHKRWIEEKEEMI